MHKDAHNKVPSNCIASLHHGLLHGPASSSSINVCRFVLEMHGPPGVSSLLIKVPKGRTYTVVVKPAETKTIQRLIFTLFFCSFMSRN